jgi:hypothetical protein
MSRFPEYEVKLVSDRHCTFTHSDGKPFAENLTTEEAVQLHEELSGPNAWAVFTRLTGIEKPERKARPVVPVEHGKLTILDGIMSDPRLRYVIREASSLHSECRVLCPKTQRVLRTIPPNSSQPQRKSFEAYERDRRMKAWHDANKVKRHKLAGLAV